jgi:hypothetical protein
LETYDDDDEEEKEEEERIHVANICRESERLYDL